MEEMIPTFVHLVSIFHRFQQNDRHKDHNEMDQSHLVIGLEMMSMFVILVSICHYYQQNDRHKDRYGLIQFHLYVKIELVSLQFSHMELDLRYH